jgi:iron complex outermembrane receptor protein
MFNKNNYLMMVMVIFFGIFNIDLIAQDDDEDVEEVVVTGSRIATSEFTGAQPVVVIDQEDIANSVELSVAEVLRELPINTAGSFYERSG